MASDSDIALNTNKVFSFILLWKKVAYDGLPAGSVRWMNSLQKCTIDAGC